MTNKIEEQPQASHKTIIEFTSDAMPTITNYNEVFAADYGQYPNVRLITETENGERFDTKQAPKFTYKEGCIDTISFDLGYEATGCIVLSW